MRICSTLLSLTNQNKKRNSPGLHWVGLRAFMDEAPGSVSVGELWSQKPNHHLAPPQSCPTLSHPMDCNPPGSPVPGILQARALEWVAISSSRGPSLVSRTAGQFFTTRATLDFSPSEVGAAQRLCGAQRSWDSEGRPAAQGARARGGQSASLSCRQSEEGQAGRTGVQEGSTV